MSLLQLIGHLSNEDLMTMYALLEDKFIHGVSIQNIKQQQQQLLLMKKIKRTIF